MNRLKSILSVIIIFLIAFSLFSCTKSQSQQETTTSAVTATTEATTTETKISTEEINYTFNRESNTLTIDGSKACTLANDDFEKIIAELQKTDFIAENIILTEGLEEIGNNTFHGEKNLKSITLPASLSVIGHGAFYNCENLKSITVAPYSQHFTTDEPGVLFTKDMQTLICYPPALPNKEYTIPESVTTISSNAFYFCPNLQQVHMPSKFSGELTYCFYCCDNIETITVPANSLEYYSDEQGVVYKKDTNEIVFVPAEIASLEFPENVKTFFYDAMINNEFITEIILTNTSTDIEDFLFRFTNLKKVTINGDNPNYSSVDGVLYNKDKTVLLWYPPMKEETTFKVPDGVERINHLNGEQLERIIISNSVKVIDDSAFYGCENLEYIHLGKGFEKIDYNNEFSFENENIFSQCKKLKKITVDSHNKNFVIDKYGALCTADMKYIITLPANSRIRKYVVSDSVIHILNCFANCSDLKKLHIGSNVKYISVGEEGTETIVGFLGCISLEEITVSEKNKNYTSENGILYSKDKTELCLYPANKAGEDFVVPDSVERIGDFAFLDTQNLERLYMGDLTVLNFVFEIDEYQITVDIYYSCEKEDFPLDYYKDEPKVHFGYKELPQK